MEAMRTAEAVQVGVHRGRLGDRPAWLLLTRNTAVALYVADDHTLLMPYWGGRGESEDPADYPTVPAWNRRSEVEFVDGFPLAYPVHGEASFKEPCLVVVRGDGSRVARLEFVEDRVREVSGRPVLDLVFQDPVLGLRVVHHFAAFVEQDLIARSVSLENRGTQVLTLERAFSAALPLPAGDYDVLTLHGQWGREFGLWRRPLLPGKFTTESRRGTSSHEAHPWFAVRPRGESAEHSGSVWFGSLAWSGNWQAVFEVERNDALNIVMGIQAFDFAWRLEPGETFEAPELVVGYSSAGLGGAAHLLHAYEAEVQLPANHHERVRPVLYNSWEATLFDVRAEQQLALARRAAEMGVELFVVDDGWFGARDSDHAGLGDWTVNRSKLRGGLRELVDEVHRLGMQFGIWVEPEMVNPDSDLYRAHPDWAYHATGRAPTFGRNQLVLNFARPEVQAAIYAQLRNLLKDHGRIDFVKWDHNRNWTEVGWPEEPLRQREVWTRHVLGVYDVMSRLRAEFPWLMIESCAGGGGRADLGMLRWTDQVWTSDNTDAADRLLIQYGYSRAHNPRTMVCWVTDVPNHQTGRMAPLEFRFHVAMQGVLGIGGDIGSWSVAELDLARRLVHEYKRLRPLVQHGRQYWLVPPSAVGPCAVAYVSPSADELAVFMYQVRGVRGAGARRACLYGLSGDRRYRRESDGMESTGAALMEAGIPLDLVSAADPRLDWRSRIDIWRGA